NNAAVGTDAACRPAGCRPDHVGSGRRALPSGGATPCGWVAAQGPRIFRDMIEAIRQWAARHTAERRYSPVGVGFHWVMAALISFQVYWGWHMSRLPVGADKLDAFRLHSELGLLMLLLAALRLLWRIIVPGPVNDAD